MREKILNWNGVGLLKLIKNCNKFIIKKYDMNTRVYEISYMKDSYTKIQEDNKQEYNMWPIGLC